MYRLLAVVFLAVPLLISHSSPVAASAPTQLTFLQTVASDDVLSSRTAGGNTFIVDVARGEFVGLGSFIETDYFLLHADGTGVFHGVDTCACTIDGRSGTLTIRYTGTMGADGTFVSPFVVMHGTGDLAGLHGTGTTTGNIYTSDYYTNVMQYHFAP